MILVFLALAGASTLAFQPVARTLRNEIAKIEEKFIARAETAIGRKITYAAMRPHFSSFDITQVQIHDDDSRTILSVGRLRVSYSLIALLRRDYNAIRTILIDKPSVTLDLQKDNDIIELLSGRTSGKSTSQLPSEETPQSNGKEKGTSDLSDALSFLPNRVLLKIRGGQCTVIDGGANYTLSGVYANLQTDNQELSLDGRCSGGVSLSRPFGLPNGPPSLAARFNMRVTGNYATDLQEGKAHLVIPFIATDTVRLRSLAFDMNVHKDSFELNKSRDALPYDFAFKYNTTAKTLSANYSCTDLLLGDLVTLEQKRKNAASILSLKSSGKAEFAKKADSSIAYNINLVGTSQAAKGSTANGGAFTVRAEGTEAYAKIDKLYVLLPTVNSGEKNDSFSSGEIDFSGKIGFKEFASTSGYLSLKDFSLSDKGRINTGLTIASSENRITVYGKDMSIANISIDSVALILEQRQQGIGFTASVGSFRDANHPDQITPGLIALNGLFDTDTHKIKANLNLDLLPMYELESIVRPFNAALRLPVLMREVLQRTFITTEISLETDFKSFFYDAPRIVISFEPWQEDFTDRTLEEQTKEVYNEVCLISLSGTDKRFDLRDVRFVRGGETFSLHGYADYTNPMDITFSVMANYADVTYYLEGLVRGQQSISVQGSHGISVFLDSNGKGSYSGYIQGQNIPVINREQTGYLSFFSSMRYNTNGTWTLDIDNIILNDIAGPAGKVNLHIMGNADQNGAHLSRFFYSDDKGPLNGSAEFTWRKGRNAMIWGNLAIEGTGEAYLVLAEYTSGKLSVDVSGRGMQLGRFSDQVYNALADADFALQWNPRDSFTAELNVHLVKALVKEKEFSAVVHAVLNQEEFTVRNLRFMYAGIEGVVPLCTLNIAEGRLDGEAVVRGDIAGRELDSSFAIGAHFGDIESWLSPGNAINNFNGEINVKNIRYASFDESGPFSIVFAHTRGEITVSGGPKNMLRLNTDREGNFYAAVTAPSPVRASVTGIIEKGLIEARCGDLYVDLKGLWEFIPPVVTDFALAGGYVNAQVEISGPISDPDFFGTIKGHSLNIQVPHFIPRDIRPIPFSARMNGKEIIIDSVPASVGSGAGTVKCWFLFERWIPDTFRIDVSVPSQTPIPFDIDITGFLAEGDVSGNLTLSMENRVLDVTGELYGNNAQMGVNSDEIARAQGQNLFASSIVPVVANITVVTGPTVEFIGPNINYPIIRANPDIGTRVEITADSFAQQFTITSDVKIRSGEVFYFERRFYIRSGTLVFRENEQSFDPRLTVRAEIRDRTDDGPVTILMIVDNAPLLSFTARFESIPSLAQVEIFSLLGQSITGVRSDEEMADYQRLLLNSGVDILAQFMGARQFEREIRKFMRMDMFSFRTQFFQNLVILPGGAAGGGTASAASGSDRTPVDRIAGVGNYFDNTTVFLGKYIGADIFAQSMLALRYDNNKISYGGLGFEWDIGVEMQTPIFDIRWDLSPTNPENWWVNNSSITLTVRRAF